MLDLSNFGENSSTDVEYMFSGCSSLIQVDLGSFNSKNINNASHMFDGCEKLANVDLSKFDMTKADNYEGMFNELPEEGSIIYNETFNEEVVKLVPGGWEKINIKK